MAEKKSNRGISNLVIIGVVLSVAALIFYALLFRWELGPYLFLPLIVIGLIMTGIGLWSSMSNQALHGEDIPCPNCGHKYHLPSGLNSFNCPICRKKILVAVSDKTGKKKAFISPN